MRRRNREAAVSKGDEELVSFANNGASLGGLAIGGYLGSTVAQTVSQSTGVMASQPIVLTPEEVAIQRAAIREAQLQQALGEIKAEKEKMIRRKVRMQQRQVGASELEEMDLTHMSDDVRTIRSVLLDVIEMQDHQTALLQDIQQSLDILVGGAQAVPSPSGSGAWPVVQGTQPQQQLVQQPAPQGPQAGLVQVLGQSEWVPKTAIAAPKPFTGDKRGEDLNTWLRAVPVYVKWKLTLPHEEVFVAASYLEGSAAGWLSGLVQLQGYGHDFLAWAVTQKLDDFLKLVEDRWHDPQAAQKASDAILTLHTRQFKSVREATVVVERLICVCGVRYDPQFWHRSGKHVGPVGIVVVFDRVEVVDTPSPSREMAQATDSIVVLQTRSDPSSLCSMNVLESLDELEEEWSRSDPLASWTALVEAPKGEMFVSEVVIGGRKDVAYYDTCSTRNFISRACVERLRLQGQVQHLSRPVESTCANKQRMVVNDYLQNVECCFPYAGGELRHRVSFLVSDDLPMDILLGMYYLFVVQPQFDWDQKVVKHTLPGGGTARLRKFKASSLIEFYGCMCAAAFYNYYKQNQEEGMCLVYVSAAGEPVKMSSEIEGVVAKYPDLFEEPTGVVEREVVHAIEIIPGSSILKGRIYQMSPGELDELRQQLKELIEKGWIRPSVSPYGSPVLFIPKKGGTLTMCIDYRGLNTITVKNREPLPRIDDLLDRVQGCRYFSKIDMKSDYHQIAIRPEDQHKTAFKTKYGLYEFVVMPFGLCNAPGTFQHAMNRIFHDYLDKFVIVYLDDILIFSRTVEEHVAHLDKVLNLLRQHKFEINGEKCEFGHTRILYLGHEIFAEGLKPDDAKVASIRDWPRPQSVIEMRSFLGMTSYCRNFVKNHSIVAAPLTDLTRLDTPWEWTGRCEAAFRQLKHALTHHEVLKLPDPDKPFVVTTDASQYGIGAVLAQQEGKKLRSVEYMSKKMPSQKLAKSTYEKELYAIYKAFTHWRHYLLGRFFYVRTDHQPLKWMRTQLVLSDALKCWIEVIEQYDFEPQYIKGEYNKVVDALSRRPDFFGALITEFGLVDDVAHSMVEAYREDQFMSEIIRILEAKDKITSAEFVNGLLFLEKEGNKHLCVPNRESLRSLFLGECHDATGHFGFKKAAANLLQRFWWPTMMRDAKLYVETCQVCQRDKPHTQAPLGLLKPLPIPERLGESLSMDFMDTLVTNKSGMRHIFVILDRFSKYAKLVAMSETAKTEYMIRLFKENWVRDFGLPKPIVSDRDVRFTNDFWEHPEANGQAEQLNRAVQHLLWHYIKPNQVDWDEKLALIASLYNNAVHSATGVCPSSLLLTFKPRLPLDFLLPDNQSTAAPGTLEFAYCYEQLMQQAVEQMHKAQAAMIETENKHHRPSTFQCSMWDSGCEILMRRTGGF
ncbi:hypothetical protein CBR_g88564 [Chara braunii]|uniref:Integrase catalytic domain-containing protein n=1 Tax=Chara braunii TaxID=69332 RepID=A0A388KB35_CHABU|nr:hypothetical protein CBR_g88564 [Chara braunii]|eukprot:GBG67275.1 hypothetical protein CBR_g88564 [Chara braunii]